MKSSKGIKLNEVHRLVYDNLPTMKNLCCQPIIGQASENRNHEMGQELWQSLDDLQPKEVRNIPHQNEWLVQKNVALLQQRLQDIQQMDFAYLCKNQLVLENEVEKALQIYSIIPDNLIAQNFGKLLGLLDFKIEDIQRFARKRRQDAELPIRQLYPHLLLICQKLKVSFSGANYKALPQGKRKFHVSDILFNLYMRQLEYKVDHLYNSKAFHFPYSEQPTTIQRGVSLCSKFFDPETGWSVLFQKLQTCYKERIQNRFVLDLERAFIKNIQETAFPNIQCLGCSDFLYAGQNIYKPSICRHQLALMGRVDLLMDKQDDLVQQVCGLLNNQGGVILFDCVISYLNIFPRGNFFTESEMKETDCKIAFYLKDIQPCPQIGTHVFISWVPIAENPIRRQKLKCQFKPSISLIDNLFVLRIIVKPKCSPQAYYCRNKQGRLYVIRTKSIFLEYLRKIEGMENIQSIIKHKNNIFWQQKQQRQLSRRYTKGQGNFLTNHTCTSRRIPLNQPISSMSTQRGDQSPRQQYAYISLMIWFLAQPEKLHLHLKQYGIYCRIDHLENRKIARKYVSVIYHNCRFEQLAAMGKEKDAAFSFFYITDYLRIINQSILQEQFYTQILEKLRMKFPNVNLKIWRLQIAQGRQFEYYFEAGSKEASAELFSILNSSSKCMAARFQNPENIEEIRRIENSLFFHPVYIQGV